MEVVLLASFHLKLSFILLLVFVLASSKFDNPQKL